MRPLEGWDNGSFAPRWAMTEKFFSDLPLGLVLKKKKKNPCRVLFSPLGQDSDTVA